MQLDPSNIQLTRDDLRPAMKTRKKRMKRPKKQQRQQKSSVMTDNRMQVIPGSPPEGVIPIRVTHNDPGFIDY